MIKRWFRYLRYVSNVKWIFILGLLSGVIAGAASGFGVPVMIRSVFPVVFDHAPLPASLDAIVHWCVPEAHIDLVVLIVACLLAPVVFSIRGVASFINAYLMAYVGMKVLEVVRLSAFDKLQKLPLAFHERQKRGDLISRLLADAENVKMGVIQVSADVIKQPVTFIGAIWVLIKFTLENSASITLLFNVLLLLLSVYPIYYFGKKLMKKSAVAQARLGDIMAVAQENLASQREVRSYNMQEQQIGIFQSLIDQFIRVQLKTVKYKQFMVPVLEGICAIGLAYMLVRSHEGGMKQETFMAMALALYFCYDSVKRLGATYSRLKQAQASLERLSYILDEPDTMPDPKHPVDVRKVRGDLVFDHVNFSYDGHAQVLHDINVSIPAGQVVALVGPSGAGKTTFASLVPRFYDVQSGSVQLDGVDVRKMSKAGLRSHIALVSQHPIIFRSTIAENIKLGKPGATDEEVLHAAQQASVHEFAETMPAGYNTQLSDGGGGLSGGQRQRVAIARAFLKDAPVLILDEATASLDAESEAKIQEELDTLVQGRTTLIVAHRFSSIRVAQRILVFEHGCIIGDGTHDELYASCPLYKELYDKQFL